MGYKMILKSKALFDTLFCRPTNNTWIQFFRATFVGGIAFVVDFSVLYILTDIMGIYYLYSAAIAFLFGLMTNYLLSISWVFQKRTCSKESLELLLFALVGIFGLGWNELLMWLFTEKLSSHYLFSKVLATIFVYLWNFTMRKFLLFR